MNKHPLLKAVCASILIAGMSASFDARAQDAPAARDTRFTFVPLAENANAVIAEPSKMDKAKRHIVILIAHPEHINAFTYFIAPETAKRGYRTMIMNYYGKEKNYEEFLQPLATAMKYLRSLPGVDKVILAGHSSGGAELTYYQDVAENGPKACQAPNRISPCDGAHLDNLPKADGLMLLDANIGGPLRVIAVDPAVDNEHPTVRNQELDMFDAHNGFDAATHSGHYTSEFENRFFQAQQERNQEVLNVLLDRLDKIKKGAGQYRDDEPFTLGGGSTRINGARIDLADRNLLVKTHAPHMLLKADGTKPVQIIQSVLGGAAISDDLGKLWETSQSGTVRHYLSFFAFHTTADYRLTADDIKGIDWRSSANSAVGNIEGITVPTLVMTATCAVHIVPGELAYDHSPAKDKEYVSVEGGDHFFKPCKPEYGDPVKRTFDYVDHWLMKPGRFGP
jgi:pimeloyl-ACP methyl ester carboxylesterase